MTDATKTQPIPANWRSVPASTLPQVRVRYPRNTASMATTTVLPIILVEETR